MIAPIDLARSVRERFAVASTKPLTGLYDCLLSVGTYSRSTGAVAAIFWARSTISLRLASSRSFVEAEPRLPPTQTVTFALRATRVPLVKMLFAAKRRCESLSLPRSEEHTSELQSQSNLVC